eukprot:g26880.t1
MAAASGLWMSYDFTPFEVRVTTSRKSLFHFFTECCAILGGIFAFSGMLDNFAHQIHKQEVIKARKRWEQASAAAKQRLDLHLARVKADCREMLRGTAIQWEKAERREKWQKRVDYSRNAFRGHCVKTGVYARSMDASRRAILDSIVPRAKVGDLTTSIEEFGRLMYKIELSQWPDLSDDDLERIVALLNRAAHKWHRAGGNWFKIFNQIDADGSGNLSYDELVSCVRSSYPCLRVSTNEVTDKELRGLWKALDSMGSIEVPVHRFMVFMRRWSSGDAGLHKKGDRSKVRRALSSYYIDQGYLSVASASEAAAWHGGARFNDSSCSWTRFFSEMDTDRSGRLSYNHFLRVIFSKLKPWLDPKVTLPVGGCGRNVSKEDVRALWDKLDWSKFGHHTRHNTARTGMMLGLYQVQLEAWPELDTSELERIATLINQAAVKRLRSGGNNWYKIFNLVDKAQSGRLSFGSLREVLRDMWYGLALSPNQISDCELKGLQRQEKGLWRDGL